MVTRVWVVSRLRLKGPSWYLIFIYISPLTSSGQRSRASWATQHQKSATLSPQPGGKTTKFIRTGCGNGEKKEEKNIYTDWYKYTNTSWRMFLNYIWILVCNLCLRAPNILFSRSAQILGAKSPLPQFFFVGWFLKFHNPLNGTWFKSPFRNL